MTKPSFIEEIIGPGKFHQLELNKESPHLLPWNKFHLGFEAGKELKAMQVGNLTTRKLRTEFKDFVVKAIVKILQKTPIAYALCRSMDCLVPDRILNRPQSAVASLSAVMSKLEECGHISADAVDKVKLQFAQVKELLSSGEATFNSNKDRLDEFWKGLLDKEEFAHLWPVVRRLLVMSHGQAAVERGFSVNSEDMTVNKAELTLVVQRSISEHIAKAGGVEKVHITPALMSSVRGSRQKYEVFLDKQRKKRSEEAKGEKRKLCEEEVEALRSKVKRMKEATSDLTESADRVALEAESSSSLTRRSKAHAFRQAAAEKSKQLQGLEVELQQKQLELTYTA